MAKSKKKMASKKDTTPIDVSWDDQRNICTFNRMFARHNQLTAMIAAKERNMEDINDAADEIYISDTINFVFGEAFVEVDCNEAEELLDKKKEKEQADLDGLKKELDDLENSMKELKAKLYAKFGSQIYLENK